MEYEKNLMIQNLTNICKEKINEFDVNSKYAKIGDFIDFDKIKVDEMIVLIKKDKGFIIFLLKKFQNNNLDIWNAFYEKIDSLKFLKKVLCVKEIFNYFLACFKEYAFNELTKTPYKNSVQMFINMTDEQALLNELTNSDQLLFYRGQSNYKWDLIPSIYRNLNNNCLIDIDSLYFLYGKKTYNNSLINLYNISFPSNIIRKKDDINYNFLAWMQHSSSFSPFIDFTKDYKISTLFALANQNPIEFQNIDSSIFILEVADKNSNVVINNIEDVNKFIKQTSVYVLQNKIVPGEKLKISKIGGKKTELVFDSVAEIKEILIPKYKIIDISTNDRMIRQQGVFLFLYNFLIVKNKIFSVFDYDTFLYKRKINITSKKSLSKILSKDNLYLNSIFLMNPYLLFKNSN